MVIAPRKGAKVSLAGPARIPGVEDSWLSVMQGSMDELRGLLLIRHCDQQDGSKPAKGKALARRSRGRAGAITSQPESVSGEHGVPFLATDKSRSSTSKGALSGEPVPPGPLVPREEVTNFILKRKICHRSSFGVSCDPKRCSFVHDGISPGYYQRTERRRWKASSPSGEPMTSKQARRGFAAMMIMSYKDRRQ